MSKKFKVSMRGRKLKGSSFERELVKIFQEVGLAAVKTPLSGADRAGRYTSPMKIWSGYDISVPMLGRDHKIECKFHGTGFARLYNWLAPVDLLVVRANHKPPLAVMPIELLLRLIAAAEEKK